MKIPVARITHLKSVSKKPASLDSPINDEDGSSLGDMVPDDKSTSPLENLQSKSLIGDVDKVLSTLEPREADIIRLRFGLEGEIPKPLKKWESKLVLQEKECDNFKNRQFVSYEKT